MNEQELKQIEDRCNAAKTIFHPLDYQIYAIRASCTDIPALIAEVRRLQENAKFFSCAWCKEQAEPHIFEMSEHGGYDEQGQDICDGCSEAAEWGP